MAASAREFPFYGADGSHRATLPVETDAEGLFPYEVELIGPDADGQLMRWRYELGRRPSEPGGSWAYAESAKRPYDVLTTRVEQVPATHSPDALRRLLAADDWPSGYLG
jgi:hypothetical protein